MARTPPPVIRTTPEVVDQSFTDLLSQKYLAYALSTIMARSLPDARDGLKPVHRRLLFAMAQLKLDPKDAPKKCARVVGDVIGKFHPHGDQSVYDALVRLAQDFAVRYPLIDGQGNFGNIDGDNAAAMRYTEARLTDTAMRLMDGLDENAVDFRPTYDGDGSEPIVMPAGFPNLLANGSSGIAVGMATSIPPHNVAEICDALVMILEAGENDVPIRKLAGCIKGPDFPTGGLLVESRDSILRSYETGKGSFRVRARWSQEERKGGTYQIIVTEIPYQVQKSKLIEAIAQLIIDKKLPLLDDIRDESAEDIRIVLIPKSRLVEAEVLMEGLFRTTDLEARIPLNMNVLDHGTVPRVMNLREILRAYLDHRRVVIIRRADNRLRQVVHRLEILDGYRIVYLNLDEVIRIIREDDEPKQSLINTFALTDLQADSILNMRLRSLRKLEEMEITREHKTLSAEKRDLEQLLASPPAQWARVRAEVDVLREAYGPKTVLGKRRTGFGKEVDESVVETLTEALTIREPITVICSAKGWIRAMKGHGVNADDIKYKDGDQARFVLEAMTSDKILVFATNGRFYTLVADKLPPGRGFGEPVRLIMDMPDDADLLAMDVFDPASRYLVASVSGKGFRVSGADCLAQTKTGKQVLTVDAGDEAALLTPIPAGSDHLATIGRNRKMLVFPLDQVPEMAKGKGVILQKLDKGGLSDARAFRLKDGLTFTSGSRTVKVDDVRGWVGTRAQGGKLPPNGFPKSNRFG